MIHINCLSDKVSLTPKEQYSLSVEELTNYRYIVAE
jgi:hypothetical protein